MATLDISNKAQYSLCLSEAEADTVINALRVEKHLTAGDLGVLCELAENGVLTSGPASNPGRQQQQASLASAVTAIARNNLASLYRENGIAESELKPRYAVKLDLNDPASWVSGLLTGLEYVYACPGCMGALTKDEASGTRVLISPDITTNDIWVHAPPAILQRIPQALKAYKAILEGRFVQTIAPTVMHVAAPDAPGPNTLPLASVQSWLASTADLFGYAENEKLWDATKDGEALHESAHLTVGMLAEFKAVLGS